MVLPVKCRIIAFRMRSEVWSECGASAQARNLRRSGFGHHSLRYYGRGVGCFHCTGTRRRRVTPAGTKSQEAWPGAEPGCNGSGESRGGAPKGERAPRYGAPRPRPGIGEWQHSPVWRGIGWNAPLGAPPPLSCRRPIFFLAWSLAKLGCAKRRENVFHFVIASESEAIRFCGAALDCFVAFAPRNDERNVAQRKVSATDSGGGAENGNSFPAPQQQFSSH